MSEEVKLKRVKVGGSFIETSNINAVSKVVFTAQCGEPSRVDLHLSGPNSQNKDVNVITSGKQLQEMLDTNKDFQKDTWLQNSDPQTVTLQVFEGQGDAPESEIEFTGLLSSPGFSIAPGQFASTCSLVHEDVMMESIDPSIYLRTGVVMGAGEEANKSCLYAACLTDFEDSVRKQTLNQHIQLLLDKSINGNFEWSTKDPDKQGGNVNKNFESADELCEMIHKNNGTQYGKAKVAAFLGRSTDTMLQSDSGGLSAEVNCMGADQLFSNACNPSGYIQWLCSVYGSSRNFYNFIMQTICPSFLLEYTCQFDGESKLAHPQVDSKDTTSAEVEVMSFSFNLGSRFQRPIGLVVCNGANSSVTGYSESTNPTTEMGCYPEEVNPSNGKIIHTERPAWFEPIFNNPEKAHQPKKDWDDNDRNPEKHGRDDSEKTEEAVDEAHPGENENSTSFLKLWAEKQYRLWGLKNTTATVTIPLDLVWGSSKGKKIGERYEIQLKDKGDNVKGILFKGYLNRVVHNAAVGRDTGNAVTILDFTHIKCDGVGELAGLNSD